ncbi:hypothetical protein [Mycolicibacterium gadium]|uniref:Uncharacterized protein n=1 Tax=Mycolicibacterium gadium TaxID=1794 RepID=A0A7I7WFZ6_MYCGU|nr:hypothetical protein [Mycolicibacterium gadium]BBZ16549.1 hypothetical protein MGAD_08840 [Mycolicibacterium gadium]
MIAAACAGFLIAVLWMDLIFDSQVLPHRGADVLPEPVLASICGYYRRATTTSRPMSYLIALVMAILLGALAVRFLTGDDPWWLIATSVVLAGGPIALAMARTVRNAVRLGARADDRAEQSRLARAVCGDHLVCLACMSGFLALWLAFAG